jgi:ABC-2 type transport system permease protein
MRLLGKLTWVEAKLFVREPLAMIFTFGFPFLMLIVLAGVFGNELESGNPEDVAAWRGVGPTDYYAPAYVALVMASIGLVAMPLRIAGYRERGVLRRFRAAGFGLATVVGSQVIVGLTLIIIGALGIGIISRLFYGAMLPESYLEVAAAFALGAVCFTAIGVALGAILPTARTAQGAGIMLFFTMLLLSGSGPPREVLGDAMRWISNPLPLTHVVLALQTPWLGYGWDTWAILWIVVVTVASIVVALRFFRWD